MGNVVKYGIILTNEEREELEELTRKQSMAQNIAKRANIILMANNGKNKNIEIAQALNINAEDITKWTKRWIETVNTEDVQERLTDLPRSGRPAVITAEQWTKIMALACEKPEIHGVPITQWSHSTLAAEIMKQGIVNTISPSWVGDFLKKPIYSHTKAHIG